MRTEIYTNEQGQKVEVIFDDLQYELLEKIDCYDSEYACRGYDADGNTYSGIASISCDECVGIEDIEQIN